MGEWSGARLRGDWDHLCGTCARASINALRRERDEDRVRSGVGASGERSHRRSAGSDRSSGVRHARCGDAAVLRSADVLASSSSRPCGVDAAGVRDHRLDAARGPRSFCERGRAARFRRIGDTRGLGRCDHSDRVESGWHRSPRSGHRRRWRLRGCGSAGGFIPTPPSSPPSTCSRSSSAAASSHGDGWLMLRERRQAVCSFQSAETEPNTSSEHDGRLRLAQRPLERVGRR